MHLLVTREVPEIIPISADDLSSSNLFWLNYSEGTDKSEFVICRSKKDRILVNKSLPCLDDIVSLIDQIMRQEYMDEDGITENLFNSFANVAGKKAEGTLIYIWRKWRKERRKVEDNERAKEVLAKIEKGNLKRYLEEMGDREGVLEEISSIGFGTYDEKAHCDFEKGEKNAFLYGYLCCLEDIKKRQIEELCAEYGSE